MTRKTLSGLWYLPPPPASKEPGACSELDPQLVSSLAADPRPEAGWRPAIPTRGAAVFTLPGQDGGANDAKGSDRMGALTSRRALLRLWPQAQNDALPSNVQTTRRPP